jgi:PKD repeat protein
MKVIFTICFAVLAVLILEAQIGGPYIMQYVPHDTGNATPYLIRHIISDYGPRDAGSASYWHRGIDYQPNNKEGNQILSPCNGIIRRIRMTTGGMFYMIVEGATGERHFGYAHLFRNKTIPKGQFWEEGPNGREMAIFREDEDEYILLNLDTDNRYALAASTITRDTITYKGVRYNIQSTVTPTMPLAILGNSGTTGIHLHLYAYRDIVLALANFQSKTNCYDPIAVIDYEHEIDDTPTQYSCTFQQHEIKYGDSHNSYFKVRPRMNGANTGLTYSHAVMDVDLVELFITPEYSAPEAVELWGNSNSAYQYYRGEHFESRINQGGRINVTPNSIYPFGNSGGITVREPLAGPTRTKLEPHAYSDATGFPYDDYWFSDFYPRIDKNHTLTTTKVLAPHNLRARYPDGNYHAHIRVKTSKGNIFSSSTNDPEFAEPDTLKFEIDNFLPFVRKVVVSQGVWLPQYSREWLALSNGAFQIEPEPVVSLEYSQCTIKIITSEAMSEVRLQLRSFDVIKTEAQNPERTEWEFIVAANHLQNHSYNQLKIYGKDVHGNALQKNASSIPIRQANLSWSPPPLYGWDENHRIKIGQPPVDFIAEMLGTGNNRVEFTALSSITPIHNYVWNFGDGTQTVYSDPVSIHNYASIGVYSVTLTINTGQGSFYITKDVVVQPLTTPVSRFIFSPRLDPSAPKGEKNTFIVNFFDDSEGIISEYLWDFGDGRTSEDKNPKDIEFEEDVPYIVSLKVKNHAGNDTHNKDLYFNIYTTPWLTIWDHQVTWFLRELDVSVSNLEPPYTYKIEYGDGSSEEVSGINLSWHTFTHNYQQGNFLVKAYVTGTDVHGQNQTISFAKNIWVYPHDLELGLHVHSEHDPIHPLLDVEIQPLIYNATPGYYYGNLHITKQGDPLYYQNIPVSGINHINPRIIRFEEVGNYKIELNLQLSVTSATGYAFTTLAVENAPKFISAGICCQPYQLAKGGQKTFEASIFPAGNPASPDWAWHPTNVRWKLFDNNYNFISGKEEEFDFNYYLFIKHFTIDFPDEGNFILRLESWNNTHDYQQNGFLDPVYNNSISFYNFDEKHITVSADLAYLVLDEENSGHYQLGYHQLSYANQSFTVNISNPSSTGIDWTATPTKDWIQVNPSSGNQLCSGNEIELTISILENPHDGARYGQVKIVGLYPNGDPVQGSPKWVQIEQFGQAGPPEDLITGIYDFQQFGYAVAVDGKTAVIGSPGKTEYDPSFAWIYEKDEYGFWIEKALLVGPANQKHFGRAVDIHGEYVIVGSSWNAQVYKKPAGGWSGIVLPLKVLETNQSSDYGRSVAIWGDYAVVGARKDGSSEKGSIYIYFRDKGGIDNWGWQKKINGTKNYDHFGNSVDIYNDLIAVGAPQRNDDHGYIDVYNRNKSPENPWELEQRIHPYIPPDYEGPDVKFGQVVSIFENRLATVHHMRRYTIQGWKHEYRFPLFCKNNYLIWENCEYAQYNFSYNYDNHGHTFSSVSLYKDFKTESPHNYEFYAGASSFYNNEGRMLHTFIEKMGSYSMFRLITMNYDIGGYWWPEAGTKFANSVSQSYNAYAVGIPGYKNSDSVRVGRVIFDNNDRKKSLCDAEIDLSYMNFRKKPGSYDSIMAQVISIGGDALPAVFEPGSSIRYVGNEIILGDGFEAEYGSDFEAEAKDCHLTSTQRGEPNYYELLSANEGSNIYKEEEYISINRRRMLTLPELHKYLMMKEPELLWNEIDFFSVNNIVGFYDHELNAISIKEAPQQELLIDMQPDREGLYLIMHLNNGSKSKFLIHDFRTIQLKPEPYE